MFDDANKVRAGQHLSALAAAPATSGPTPEEAALAAEDRQILMRAINSLPADQRQIITLRAINDLSYAEIAKILNIQEGTVKSRLSRARTELKNKLLQNGNKKKREASTFTEGRDAP